MFKRPRHLYRDLSGAFLNRWKADAVMTAETSKPQNADSFRDVL